VKTTAALGVFLLGITHLTLAQVHGLGFIQGTVVDQKGSALGDVTYTANLPRVGGRIVGKTDDKGEWRIIAMAHGEWDLAFEKRGYVTNKAHVIREPELIRIPKGLFGDLVIW